LFGKLCNSAILKSYAVQWNSSSARCVSGYSEGNEPISLGVSDADGQSRLSHDEVIGQARLLGLMPASRKRR